MVEGLEPRTLLAGATCAFDFGLPERLAPPEEYRSPKISDMLAELAYEYDQWIQRPVHDGFVPSDSRIRLDGDRVYFVALTTGAGSELGEELTAIGGEVESVGDTDASGWLPISSVELLKSIDDLLFARPEISSAIYYWDGTGGNGTGSDIGSVLPAATNQNGGAGCGETPIIPSSVALPFGPEYETTHECGDFQCLKVPKLFGAAMLSDGTLRLVGGSANFSPSPLTVFDVDSSGQIVRQFDLRDALHVNPFSGSGRTISISPNGQWIAIGTTVYPIDGTSAPQVVSTGEAFPFGAEIVGRVADNGRMLLTWNGKGYLWDAASGLKALDSLFSNDPNANQLVLSMGVDANAISADGTLVVGSSSGIGSYGHATSWDASGAHALPDFGHPSNAFAVSADGRIIGGNIGGIGGVVWIDGELTVLLDQHRNPLNGLVTSIITGIDGDANSWAAFGSAEGKAFVAFKNGIGVPLSKWLAQQQGIELADESLMGAFYHDGGLSLVTEHYQQNINCFPDPIDCAMIAPSQLAAHLTVVPVSDTAAGDDEASSTPFQVTIPPDGVYIDLPGTITPTADGFQAIGYVGNENVVKQYDRTGQLIRTIHLASLPGHTTGVTQFSDDGRWVAGHALTPTDGPIALYWDLEHPDQPLTEEPLDADSRPVFSTAGGSADGRVAVVPGEGSAWHAMAVRVDGVDHEIKDASGAALVGQIDHLFTGIGGVATRWIAVGQYSATGGYGGYFIAFSDGSMQPLFEFIRDQWPGEGVRYPHYSNVAIDNGSLLFVERTFSGPNCDGMGCGGAMSFVGYTFTSVPLPDKWVRSPMDIDRDDHVVAADALIVIDYLNDRRGGSSVTGLGTHSTYDINDDGFVSPLDALLIIDYVNSSQAVMPGVGSVAAESGEGEGVVGADVDGGLAAAADEYFRSLQGRRRVVGVA